MPRRCCVPECKTNNRLSYTTVFRFPKDENLRKKWIKSIHRENFEPSTSSVVCINHFSEQFLIIGEKKTRKVGNELVQLQKTTSLSKDAYPSIFPNQPKYLSSKPPRKRKSTEEREFKLRLLNEKKFTIWCENDNISSFDAFTKLFDKKDLDGWVVIKNKNYVLFYKIEHVMQPLIIVSFKIFEDFSIKVWHNQTELMIENFEFILGNSVKCDKWTKFDSLLSHLKSFTSTYSPQTSKEKLKQAANLLEQCIDLSCISNDDENEKIKLKRKGNILKFLKEQINLVDSKKIMYSSETVIWACSIFYCNAASYRIIRDSQLLTLPHPSYLKKFALNLRKNESGLTNAQIAYLEGKTKILKPEELVVNVLLDEIDVKQGLHYKGGCLEEFSIDSNENATTNMDY